MLINKSLAISTPSILLVPYESHHVPTYHSWIQDPDIQEATASEPLSLEEEYAMQRSWRNDPDKLTFIACAPHTTNLQNCGEQELPEMLLGDVNLFLTTPENPGIIVGEIELMIAVKNLQGHGYGRATLLAFLKYIVQHEKDLIDEFSKDRMDVEGEEGIQELVAKIGEGNIRSIGLFESVGFQKVGEEVNYFGEWELRLGEGWRDVVRALGFENYREVEYMANGGD